MLSTFIAILVLSRPQMQSGISSIEVAHDALMASARALTWHWTEPGTRFMTVLNKRLLKVPSLPPDSLDLLVKRIADKGEDEYQPLRLVFILHVLRTVPLKAPKSESNVWLIAYLSFGRQGTIADWNPWSLDKKTLTINEVPPAIGSNDVTLTSFWLYCREELELGRS